MKPVTIAMAVYNPDSVFFEKQLRSLEKQDYANFNLLIVDDGSQNQGSVEDAVNLNVQNVPIKIVKHSENKGTVKTFERLVNECKSEYIAFCDQDDIWNSNRISRCVKEIESTGAALVYSDLEVINEKDETTHSTIKDCRKRVKHLEGDGLWKYFMRMNSMAGCSVLARSSIVKKAVPFPLKEYPWDQWVSIVCAAYGRISYINEPLIRYRLHLNNQTGAKKLFGINNRDDYMEKRIKNELAQCDLIISRFCREDQKEIRQTAQTARQNIVARLNVLESPTVKNLAGNFSCLFRDPLLFGMETCIALDRKGKGEKIIEYVKRSDY